MTECASYNLFDDFVCSELINPPKANEMINKPEFCYRIIGDLENLQPISLADRLTRFKGKMGVYIYWVDLKITCNKHGFHQLRAVYVGKGQSDSRLYSHRKSWWPEDEILYITFYECNNRIAKYIEQTFLDVFSFHCNDAENNGAEPLYTHWDNSLFEDGTEIEFIAEEYSEELEKYINSEDS